MKIVATETQDLYPVNIPFEVEVTWKTKRGHEDTGWWFTPTGKGKVGLNSLSLTRVGHLDDVTDEKVCSMMKKYKTDILFDGIRFYTRGMGGLAIINNGYSLLYNMHKQWDAGSNGWVQWLPKNEFIEETDLFGLIKETTNETA